MRHRLEAAPETVQWGYFDPASKPVLTIDDGDSVDVSTVSGVPEVLPPPGSPFVVPEDLALIHKSTARGPANHILTGPIAIRGAESGDVLEVTILDVSLRSDWGFNVIRPYWGVLQSDFTRRFVSHIALDQKRMIGTLPSGLSVPLAPFFGIMGVAPPLSHGRQSSKEPRNYGGNIDFKDLRPGTKLYLPVFAPGALFSVGDGHAAQGDGEVNGMAIETALSGSFEFHLRKDLDWRLPRAETNSHFVTFGFNEDINAALRDALHEMIGWIAELYGVLREDAYALASIAVDLRITQMVNGVKGAHAMLARDAVTRLRPDGRTAAPELSLGLLSGERSPIGG